MSIYAWVLLYMIGLKLDMGVAYWVILWVWVVTRVINGIYRVAYKSDRKEGE